MKMSSFRGLLVFVVAALLAACRGGGGGPTVEEVTAYARRLEWRFPEVTNLNCTKISESGAYECNFIMNGDLPQTWRLIKIGDTWTNYRQGS